MSRRPPLALEVLLWPLALLYRFLIYMRNVAYDRQWFLSDGVTARVLSVGNLTAGGTGKTPLTAFLVRGFLARGRSVGIVSRGYGGTERGPARVSGDGRPETAARFGDEPSWFARVLSGVVVFVGADRLRAARSLCEEVAACDVIVADDAFQHRRLRRVMDAVVIDATEPRWHYRQLPLGRMREGFSALTRAHAIFLTKTNLASEDQLRWLRAEISAALKRFEAPPFLFEMESTLSGFFEIGGEMALEVAGRKVLLVSGIGRPETFRVMVEGAGATVAEHLVYRDHHAYSHEDLAAIGEKAKALGVEAIVMTEKDAIKIGGAWRFGVPCAVSRLEVRVRKTHAGLTIEDFYEAFDRAVF